MMHFLALSPDATDQNGNGVPLDYVKAREWYDKAAEKDNATAMNNLGWLYQNGWGVPQDYVKARAWYKKAADTGNADAMTNLGSLYQNGNGVRQDYVKAREWYEKAADKGEGTAKISHEFGGLGIEVTMEDGLVKVVAAIDDTPAAKAGIRATDIITHIDGAAVKSMTLDQAVQKMRGLVNTKIKLGIMRKGADKPIELAITRTIIRVRSVRH